MGLAELKICGLEEMLDSLVSIDCDITAIIVGGWFDFVCTYRGAFPGLEYGLYSLFLYFSCILLLYSCIYIYIYMGGFSTNSCTLPSTGEFKSW